MAEIGLVASKHYDNADYSSYDAKIRPKCDIKEPKIRSMLRLGWRPVSGSTPMHFPLVLFGSIG